MKILCLMKPNTLYRCEMVLYYRFGGLLLNLYDSKSKKIFEIPCNVGDNVLLTVEDYFDKNKIKIKFTQLLSLA